MSFLKVQWRINNVVRPLQEASVAAQKTPAGFWKLFGIWKDFFFRGDGAQVNCVWKDFTVRLKNLKPLVDQLKGSLETSLWFAAFNF